ncbi:MAG: phosphopantetheine-binding protein [Spirochaetes bacterium]|nr:phosphopantetheine-binding protein [Spirochaetota bacterium]
MDLQDFIGKFAEQFDETDMSEFKADTEFRKLAEWTSMTALSIIAMINDEYDIIIKGDDIRKSTTIEDLFNIVKGYGS